MMLAYFVGKTVKNNGKALRKLMEIYFGSIKYRHIGAYVFHAYLPEGKLAIITTEPVGEDEIRIVSVTICERD